MTTAAKYKPYTKYKPSGVDWLGKIAEGWKVKYMKNLGRFESSGIDKKIVEGEPLVQMVNYTDIYGNESRVINGKRDLMTVSCPAWKVPEADVLKGDLVFTPSSETIEDIGLSALISEDLANTVFSYHVIRFRFFEKLDHGFKKYLCNNDFVLQQFSSVAKGTTRQILDRNDFKNIIVVIPPAESQKTIADFLDRETTKIDEMVAKKQKMMELLKEKRQALITRAVTKGLDPKARMKPSGIDWLGDIPEGWEVKRLNYLMRNIVDKATESDEKEFIVALENIESWSGKFISPENQKPPEGDLKRFVDGDVLFGKLRPYLAKAMIAEQHGLCVGEALIFRVNKLLTNKFLLYRILTADFINYIDASTQGAKMPRAEWEFIKTLEIAYPSKNEQHEIIDHIDRETAKIDGIINKVETQIEKLQEYRQALISNAVTGKIKV